METSYYSRVLNLRVTGEERRAWRAEQDGEEQGAVRLAVTMARGGDIDSVSNQKKREVQEGEK